MAVTLALVCLLMIAPSGLASQIAVGEGALGSRRMLRQGAAAPAVHESATSALQEGADHGLLLPGNLTDWVVPCQGGRARCPSTFLASWGYQCQTRDATGCCLMPNGHFCVPLDEFAASVTPAAWTGHDLTNTSTWGGQAATSPETTVSQEEHPAGKEEEEEVDDVVAVEKDQDGDEVSAGEGKDAAGSDEAAAADDDEKKQAAEDKGEGEKESGSDGKAGAQSTRPSKRNSGRKPNRSGSKSGSGRWQRATATYFNSYPPCCSDRNADQEECEDYSGCKWEGYFAGISGKKSASWVANNNIVAFFESGQSSGDWNRQWKGKKLRIRNPRTGRTLDVTVADTCNDSDCRNKCCTTNANRNGGTLIDLEYHTAKRFYGGTVQHLTGIEWQRI